MSRLHRLLHRPLHQRRWMLLVALTAAFTLLLADIAPWQAAGWMQNSPPPTPTPIPPPPSPSPTIPPPTSTPPPAATATPGQPPAPTPTPTTIVIPPTLPPASPPPPTAPAPAPTQAMPPLPPGGSPTPFLTPASPQPGATPTPVADPENLIKLIDTLVLYGSYFLLGLGLILFIILAVFFYYLNRRSRELRDGSQPPEQPR